MQIRPPRFIGKDGIITPYYPNKAIGFALLNVNINLSVYMFIYLSIYLSQETDEGEYIDKEFYVDHIQTSEKPINFLIITDQLVTLLTLPHEYSYNNYSIIIRRCMIIEQNTLTEGWKSTQKLYFRHFTYEAIRGDCKVYIPTDEATRVIIREGYACHVIQLYMYNKYIFTHLGERFKLLSQHVI